MNEYVVLVDENNQPIGTQPKSEVHHADTPLHRGFSLFVFDESGNLLIQQRSANKVTWPLVWSNSFCGHPKLDESPQSAARRRLSDELNLTVEVIDEVLPDYRYRSTYRGICENEFCPVMVTWTENKPRPNPAEVGAIDWISWSDFVGEIMKGNDHAYVDFSPWCLEETKLLCESTRFQDLWSQFVG